MPCATTTRSVCSGRRSWIRLPASPLGAISAGLTWRSGYATVAVIPALLALAFLSTARAWANPSAKRVATPPPPASGQTWTLSGLWLGAAAGLVLIGFAAAPMFPLLTLTTAERVGAAHADRAIGVQSGASSLGAATLPAGIGVLIGHVGPGAPGPSLLLLATALGMIYVRSRKPAMSRR